MVIGIHYIVVKNERNYRPTINRNKVEITGILDSNIFV